MLRKIRVKNVIIGVIVGIAILFIGFLIFYYFSIYLPQQERKAREKAVDELYQRALLYYREKELQQKTK